MPGRGPRDLAAGAGLGHAADRAVRANGYGQIREQFGLPMGRFHAIAGVIAQMACELYASDAARRYTAAVLDKGERPAWPAPS
jgi:alkylation response protein AidB-like acyl-CoA dehydrogenase